MNSKSDESPGKIFIVCALAGGCFGLVVGIIFSILGITPFTPVALMIGGLTLFPALISGLGGMGGYYLELFFLRRGMSSPVHRLLITFIIIAVIPFSVTTLLIFRNFNPEVQRYSFIATFLGVVFGALIAFINYRLWTVKQKMATLEMENRYLAELAEKNQLLQEAARNLAVAEERNRMARELHDSISQGIHGIVYSLRSMRKITGTTGREGEILQYLEETTEATLQELRRLIMELKPSPLEEHNLTDALSLHCDLFARRQKVQADLQIEYAGNLQSEQEVALYRIAQEALANIQQHAGADKVEVRLAENAGTVKLTVKDNGRGFDPATVKKGNGLDNMAIRARQNGGDFRLHSHPGEGTMLEVSFTAI